MLSLWWPTLRSLVLACLIVANAIVTSAGVWHLSLSEYGGQIFSLDIYVIVISALALLGISSIVFFEYALPDPHLVPLWLETSWAAILFLSGFAGAVAVSSLGSDMMCSRVAALPRPLDACVANKLLSAFLWISTIIVLLYAGALVSFIIRARGKNFSPWRNLVRNLHWSDPGHYLPSVPASPTSRPRFQASLIVAPQPRPAHRPLHAFRSGLGSEYEIEHYQPPRDETVPPLPDSSPSFYPDHLKHKLTPVIIPSPLTPAPSPPPVPAEPAPIHTREARKSLRPLPQFPPSLLGDWPRSDAMVRESTKKRGKRREVLPVDSEPPQVPSPPTPPPEPIVPPAAPVVTRPPPVSMSSSPPRSRPIGPRLSGERRISSGDMPWH